jgi:hypothetical protein
MNATGISKIESAMSFSLSRQNFQENALASAAISNLSPPPVRLNGSRFEGFIDALPPGPFFERMKIL